MKNLNIFVFVALILILIGIVAALFTGGEGDNGELKRALQEQAEKIAQLEKGMRKF